MQDNKYNNILTCFKNSCHHLAILHVFFSLATYIGPQALPSSGITNNPHSWSVGANVKSCKQVLAIPLRSIGIMLLWEFRISLITSWFSALESVHVEYTSNPPGRKALIADLHIIRECKRLVRYIKTKPWVWGKDCIVETNFTLTQTAKALNVF